jgi:hypothetical protein
MLELKAETAAQDIITARRTAAIGSPLVLVAAKTRGFFDAASMAVRLLFKAPSHVQEYMAELESLEPRQIQPARRPGFITAETPKGGVLD